MSYNCRAYRILIASPSDVDAEREIAVRVIQEWNDLYSYTRGVVLLPLRWETHSAPEYGTRPQEAINRAVVDQCDLLVGIFWTRVGTPTGVADSGTLEEIDRVARAGKPIMLYFSKVGTDPEQIDLDQLRRLNTFKAATYPNALTESYKSQVDFRDKFARQLELRVRELQRADASGGPPPLAFFIAARDLKSIEGTRALRTVDVIDVVDINSGIGAKGQRADRLKRTIHAHVERAATVPVVLAITNTGPSGIRNLFVDVNITPSTDSIVVTDTEPLRPGRFASGSYRFITLFDNDEDKDSFEWTAPDIGWEERPDFDEGFRKTENGWRLTIEWAALQPNRTRLVRPVFFVKASATGTVTFAAKIFADSLPEPISFEAVLEVTARPLRVQVGDLVSTRGISADP
jgi:hypothetical protein